jgi:hypothetical protein
MVDLGFLLISFFVITVQLSKPGGMTMVFPRPGPPIELGESKALSFILGSGNTIWYYDGDFITALRENRIKKTAYSPGGIRQVIMNKQNYLDMADKKEGRDGLMLLIKPSTTSTYKNVVDALDEAVITGVKRYAVLKLSKEEGGWIRLAQ